MHKPRNLPHPIHKSPRKEQLESLAKILSISYDSVLLLQPRIELATDWHNNKDFLLIEICGDPPKTLLHEIDGHLVSSKYIHLQYGMLGESEAKSS